MPVIIAYLNVRSLVKYKEEIAHLLKELDLDVLCLNETHLSSNISDCEINIILFIGRIEIERVEVLPFMSNQICLLK